MPVLEIKESTLVEKFLCLHILPKHAGVHSFIYILLEKIRSIYRRVVCVQFSIPLLLLDSSMVAMFGLPKFQAAECAKCSCYILNINMPNYSQIMSALWELHRLPVAYQIKINILKLTLFVLSSLR